jgi:hypothetical protein
MSAMALPTCGFETAAKEAVATYHRDSQGFAAEIQFREDLRREYRREAMNAGFSNPQATEYASALSPEMGLVAGGPESAPVGRGWFYQSGIRVVQRTITSGLIPPTRGEKGKPIGRTAAAGAARFAFIFRPWNAGGKC